MKLNTLKEKLEELSNKFPKIEIEKGPGGIGNTIRSNEKEENKITFYRIFYSISDRVSVELDKHNNNTKNANIFNRVNLLINYSNKNIKNNIIIANKKEKNKFKDDFNKFLENKKTELYELKINNRYLNLIKDNLILIIENYLEDEE